MGGEGDRRGCRAVGGTGDSRGCRAVGDRRDHRAAAPAGCLVRTLVVWCPDWPVVAAGLPATVPAAVLAGGEVLACSPAARAAGVRRGMRRRDAQARCPELRLVDRAVPFIEEREFGRLALGLEGLRHGTRTAGTPPWISRAAADVQGRLERLSAEEPGHGIVLSPVSVVFEEGAGEGEGDGNLRLCGSATGTSIGSATSSAAHRRWGCGRCRRCNSVRVVRRGARVRCTASPKGSAARASAAVAIDGTVARQPRTGVRRAQQCC